MDPFRPRLRRLAFVLVIFAFVFVIFVVVVFVCVFVFVFVVVCIFVSVFVIFVVVVVFVIVLFAFVFIFVFVFVFAFVFVTVVVFSVTFNCLRFAIPPTPLCDWWLRGRVAELLWLLTGCIIGWLGGWAAGLFGEGTLWFKSFQLFVRCFLLWFCVVLQWLFCGFTVVFVVQTIHLVFLKMAWRLTNRAKGLSTCCGLIRSDATLQSGVLKSKGQVREV